MKNALKVLATTVSLAIASTCSAATYTKVRAHGVVTYFGCNLSDSSCHQSTTGIDAIFTFEPNSLDSDYAHLDSDRFEGGNGFLFHFSVPFDPSVDFSPAGLSLNFDGNFNEIVPCCGGRSEFLAYGYSTINVQTSDTSFGPPSTVIISFTSVPEPATWAMMIAGFGAIGFAMRRRSATRTAVAYA